MKSISFHYPDHLWVGALRETDKGWNFLMAGRSPHGHIVMQAGTSSDIQLACAMACAALTKYLDEQPRTVNVKAIDLDLSDI